MQLVVALPPSLPVWRLATFSLQYTYTTLSASVFGPDVYAFPRAFPDAALCAAVVDLHVILSPDELLTFQSFGKSPRRNNPRRAICASLNGGAAVDNGYGD